MTDVLDRPYREIMLEEKEKKRLRKEQYKKAAKKACLTILLILLVLFLLLIVLSVFMSEQDIDPPTEAKLESEYKEFFEKPCLKSSLYGVGMVRTERWRNQVKQTITGQAKRYDRLSRRKEIYEKHLKDCKRIITSGFVRNMADSLPSSNKTREKPPSGSRTNPGSLIEKGAYIDYRIDSDKIIHLSVNTIRSKGHRCNSLSSIKLYKYPERIVVECNKGEDRYKIHKDSAGLFRQVTRY